MIRWEKVLSSLGQNQEQDTFVYSHSKKDTVVNRYHFALVASKVEIYILNRNGNLNLDIFLVQKKNCWAFSVHINFEDLNKKNHDEIEKQKMFYIFSATLGLLCNEVPAHWCIRVGLSENVLTFLNVTIIVHIRPVWSIKIRGQKIGVRLGVQ